MTLISKLTAKFTEFKAQARKVWALSLPYFQSEQKWKARWLLASVITLKESLNKSTPMQAQTL
jgi:vitamin B12/bleomycin/antimicrobial peptide transport system ATP-binding/permease protein